VLLNFQPGIGSAPGKTETGEVVFPGDGEFLYVGSLVQLIQQTLQHLCGCQGFPAEGGAAVVQPFSDDTAGIDPPQNFFPPVQSHGRLGGAQAQPGDAFLDIHGQGAVPVFPLRREFTAGFSRNGTDTGTRTAVKAGPHRQGHLVLLGEFNGPQMNNSAACFRDIPHFFVTEVPVQPGFGHRFGVSAENSIHILEDFTSDGSESCSQGDGCGITAAAAEGGDLSFFTDSLKAGHHHHQTSSKGLSYTLSRDFDDAGVGVAGIGDDATLAACEADGGAVFVFQDHGQQTHGDAFAHRKQHVQLPAGRLVAGLAGHFFQFIGGAAHGADHHHHIPSAGSFLPDTTGHFTNTPDTGQAGAAVLADDYGGQRHRSGGIHIDFPVGEEARGTQPC